MRVQAIVADIVTLDADIIVNPANNALAAGGGASGAIFSAAGSNLIDYIAQHHPLGVQTGQVKVTPAFNLPAKFIYHTVGPAMRLYSQTLGDALLFACYNNCMMVAIKEGLKSIAFPAISTGIFKFNKKRAAGIAVEVIHSYRNETDIDVTFACFSEEDAVIINTALDTIDKQKHYLSWSIGRYPDNPDRDAEFIPDLDTDAPDGVYRVVHVHLGTVGSADGVIVKDGKFVLEPTLRACAEARNQAGYWGTFLEGLDWDKLSGTFHAEFGS